MICEMCGKDTEDIYDTLVEGTRLKVCDNCSKMGKVLAKQQPMIKQPKKQVIVEETEEPVIEELIVEDYAELIRNARSKLNLKQEELAKKLAEKESIIQKIESGNFEPSIKLARKLEKFLRIKLVEEYEEEHQQQKQTTGGAGVTIGDMINIKKK